MDVTVNGTQRQLPEGTTVSVLLQTLQVQPERVVVEVNLEILKRAEHAKRVLHGGDHVEIVQFIGGGACENLSNECDGKQWPKIL